MEKMRRVSDVKEPSPLDVFEFDGEDEPKSHRRYKKVLHADFRQRRSVITGKRVKARRRAKEIPDENKILEVIIQDDSPEVDEIETDSSDSGLYEGRWRQIKTKCDCRRTCNVVEVNVDEEAIENHSVVTIIGNRVLLLGDYALGFPTFIFTKDGIILKMGHATAENYIRWQLHEIESFESCCYDKERFGGIIELHLSTSAAEILGEKIRSFSLDNGHSDVAILSVRFETDDPLEEKIRQITGLSDDYKSLWKPAKRFDLENWSNILFPKGDVDAVTVTKNDYLLLKPNECLNDTIIDFYIKYLQKGLPWKEKERFYFFNSFFFRKLARVNSPYGYERLKRWTGGTNIFEKDFIFIPIMQSAHWSLVVVCFLRSLLSDDICSMETAVILHFDSLQGSHKDIETPIRSYLLEAWNWNSNYAGIHEKISSMEYRSVKVPQQTNYSDCGLFLLHYVELFVSEVRKGYSLNFVTADWFDPREASVKRERIKIILEYLQRKS